LFVHILFLQDKADAAHGHAQEDLPSSLVVKEVVSILWRVHLLTNIVQKIRGK